MGDLGTAVASERSATNDTGPGQGSGGRRVVPRRGLPGGRAVIGAFLVAAAAVGTFAAYVQATAAPDTRYVVASRDVAPGTELSAADLSLIAMDLPEAVAARAVPEDLAEDLIGTVTVAPLEANDLILDSAVAATGDVPGTYVISIPVARSRALQGALWSGQRVDVIATFGRSGGGSETRTVVEGARVVAVSDASGGLGQSTIVLTLALEDRDLVNDLAHAAVVADVSIVRRGPGTGSDRER
ncbi:MAG TPA: SAF domain-containing protein [Nitriliruptorales bacterium]